MLETSILGGTNFVMNRFENQVLILQPLVGRATRYSNNPSKKLERCLLFSILLLLQFSFFLHVTYNFKFWQFFVHINRKKISNKSIISTSFTINVIRSLERISYRRESCIVFLLFNWHFDFEFIAFEKCWRFSQKCSIF